MIKLNVTNKALRGCLRLLFILVTVSLSLSHSFAQNIIYPTDAGIINVKNAPYNATGNGVTDDTQAIQQALAAAGGHAVVYLPNGTYLVSNTLKWNNGNPADNGGWRGFLSMQGQSRAGTIIKLKDNTFTNVAIPQAVIMTASGDCCGNYSDVNGEGNQAFENSVTYLTVDVGSGNPGAIGIDYQVSNWGALREVTVKSTDINKVGFCGISLLRRDNGPGIIERVSVDGFQYGIRAGQEIAQFTMENVSLSSQSVVGIEDKEAVLAIRNLTSVNSVPAIRASSQSLLNLLGANLSGGAPGGSAIELVNNESRAYLRGITTSGYGAALNNRGTVVSGSSVTEWVSDAVLRLNPSSLLSLNLPIEETPDYFDSNLANWQSVGSPSGSDDVVAIQAAMNSGKSTIYFPPGRFRYSNTVTVPATVKHIIGMGTITQSTGDMGGKSFLKFVGGTSSDQTIVERFEMNITNGSVIEHASLRTLVLKDMGSFDGNAYTNQPGAGKLFIDDYASKGWRFSYPQNIWARQFNPEGDATYAINNGGNLWVLGFKVENSETLFETRNGGSTEVLGGLTYTFGNRGKPAIINNGSRVSASFAGTTYINGVYSVMVHETSGAVTTDLPISSTYGGRTYSIPMYVGVPAASTAQYRINAGGGPAFPYSLNEYFSGSNTGTFFTSDPIDVTGVTNPAPQAVYQSELDDLTGPGGVFTYSIPYLKPNNIYQVRLHFVERFFTAAGGRKFNVAINGTQVLTDFDIFAATGAKNKAIVKEFNATANATGQITIAFTTVTDRALINGIEILGTGTPTGVGTGTGLTGSYYDNIDLTNLKVTRIDPTVNFWWGDGSPDPSIFVETFSARWTGQIMPKHSETYTFYLNSDNGRRLWINNELIIDKWIDDWNITYSGAIALQAGQKYDIKIEYFENWGGAGIVFEWQSPTQAREVVPQSQLYPLLDSPGVGLTGSYYDNVDLTSLKVTRTDATVNFNWGDGSPDPSIYQDTFSVRWAGQIKPKYSETYTFYITSDNGRRVWVNDQLIIDQWIDNWDITYSGTIALQAGQKYDIKIEYFENYGGANIKFEWQSPTQAREVVPQSQLYTSPPAVNGARINVTETNQAIDDAEESELFAVYPNPTADELIIQSSKKLIEVGLLDGTGKIQFQSYERTNKLLIHVKHYPKGLYFIKARTEGNQMMYRKLIIN
jgi:hypothetical protein